MNTLTLSIELTHMNCGKCSGTFAITENFRLHKCNFGGGWYCPYCGTSWSYTESVNDQLKKQIEEAERAMRQAKCEALNNAAARIVAEGMFAEASRKLRRVKNGVCPCCKRSFKDLAAHMKTKHADQSKP